MKHRSISVVCHNRTCYR